jgi:hypothetical protein
VSPQSGPPGPPGPPEASHAWAGVNELRSGLVAGVGDRDWRSHDEGEEYLVDDFVDHRLRHGLQSEHQLVQEQVEGDAADAWGQSGGIDFAAVDGALEHLVDRVRARVDQTSSEIGEIRTGVAVEGAQPGDERESLLRVTRSPRS